MYTPSGEHQETSAPLPTRIQSNQRQRQAGRSRRCDDDNSLSWPTSRPATPVSLVGVLHANQIAVQAILDTLPRQPQVAARSMEGGYMRSRDSRSWPHPALTKRPQTPRKRLLSCSALLLFLFGN